MGRTPGNVAEMDMWLDSYLDKVTAAQLLFVFLFNFFTPFLYSSSPLLFDNLKSVRDNPDVLRDKVSKE